MVQRQLDIMIHLPEQSRYQEMSFSMKMKSPRNYHPWLNYQVYNLRGSKKKRSKNTNCKPLLYLWINQFQVHQSLYKIIQKNQKKSLIHQDQEEMLTGITKYYIIPRLNHQTG